MHRGVKVRGGAEGAVIVTGDGNVINVRAAEGYGYDVLDEEFREVSGHRGEPADFYEGTPPNWANIARLKPRKKWLRRKIRKRLRELGCEEDG